MIDRVFGQGTDLGALQMGARAVVLFVAALALVRLGGTRTFGARSPFDTTVVIMLGAVLSRAVVGASPMIATVVASTVLVLVHRTLAMACARWRWLARLCNGRPRTLFRDGAADVAVMHRQGISARDLEAAARRDAHVDDLGGVREIWLETSGDLTVVTRR